jgi:class 3 adenylate cyclase
MTPRHTFAFVDIVGFTAYTAEQGDVAAAELASRLGRRVRELLPDRAETVKSLGDGVMIRVEEPADALRLGVRLISEQDGLPAVRVGIETGPAVEYEGDWYGATVNRAARLCAAARPGQVLVGPYARAAVNGIDLAFRRRRLRRVRDLPRGAPVFVAREPRPPRRPMLPAPRAALVPAGGAPSTHCPAAAAATMVARLRHVRALACPKHAPERVA